MPAYRHPVARFVEKFEVNPDTLCWEWSAGLGSTGYGQFQLNQRHRSMKAHQFAYELWVGPRNGLDVCHRCDNPICINPDHLFLGTHQVNMADMCAKGRHFTPFGKRGEDSSAHKLTEAGVAEIRAAYVKGSRDFGTVALGRKYGVSYAAIHNIVTGKTWAQGCKQALAKDYRRAS